MLRYHLMFVLLFFCCVANAQKISVDNSYSPSKKSGYYNWTVFVRADDAMLNSIDHVEYLLHPTFPNPQVSSYNRANSFSYTSSGWGEFEIKTKVVFKDKSASQYIQYWLKLQPRMQRAAIRNVSK